MPNVKLQLIVNGIKRIVNTAPHRTLLDILRQDLGLTGTKEACSQGDCGACVVLMDGLAVNACLVLAPQAHGTEILTVEGLAQDGKLHVVQRAFEENWGFQCGYCTPGMLMASYALLLQNPHPSTEEIIEAISGNLCRCTGYWPIIESVKRAGASMGEAADG